MQNVPSGELKPDLLKLRAWVDHYPMSTRLRNGLRKLFGLFGIEHLNEISEKMFRVVPSLGKKSWLEFISIRGSFEEFIPPVQV